ncbi:TIGR02652 family protein [Prochlorothrix hollandica]|uniref:TIGR02652 family protein n=1 Tax=Prochlorothrix hollandica PCC 9006 = CALU 1027 TaxID=317619 RepID=A0A0M2PTW0_PROHO|nr:TIGR02652 family protein [Prochlorothrix hollandica]KKI98113.1 hypothetical protein PROH_20595 [Prochlorothrix hollandica PCC 9006 = CALU 1027]
MINLVLEYPVFGAEIRCPYCRQSITALTLTDTYLCSRHGAFEADPKTQDLVHLQSGRFWRQWQGEWYRQHTHPDGIRFEIHEALDRLYTEGYRATRIIIADRYRSLISAYFERSSGWSAQQTTVPLPKLYGLPVVFSPGSDGDPRWAVINFDLETEASAHSPAAYARALD